MPTRIETIPEGWSQAAQRAVAFWFDQHKDPTYRDVNGKTIMERGRPYWSYVERPANGAAMPMPVGELIPIGWTAPYNAPQNYMMMTVGRVDGEGAWMHSMQYTQWFKIQWDRMYRDDMAALQQYYELLTAQAARLNMRPPAPGAEVPWALRSLVGPPPRSPKIAEAAMGGDKWLLGQVMPVWDSQGQVWRVKENEALARVVRQYTQEGLSMTELETMARRHEEAQDLAASQSDTIRMLYERLERLEKDNAARDERRKKYSRKGPATDKE